MGRCKLCKDKFSPRYFLQKHCMEKEECIAAEIQHKKNTIWKAKRAEWKEDLKTHSDYLKILQAVFNTYIRVRDKGKPCISCNIEIKGKFDAGHFYSVGGYPSVRFNEDNVHAQCVSCNQWMHGNLIMYADRLPIRIGVERFEDLKNKKDLSNKLTIPEIKELITHYKQKIKQAA